MPYKLIKSERHAEKCRTNNSYTREQGRDGYNGDGYKVTVADDGSIVLYSFALPLEKPRKLGLRRSELSERNWWGGKAVAVVSNDPKSKEETIKLLENT